LCFQLSEMPENTLVKFNGVAVTPFSLPEFNVTGFDNDGNGTLDAATDGVIVVRYLRGVRGAPLSANAGIGKARTLEQMLQQLLTLTKPTP